MPVSGPVIIYQSNGVAGFGRRGLYVPAAGSFNNALPTFASGPAWPADYGRLDVDTTAGNVTFTGLTAAPDARGVLIRNIGVNILTLSHLNAGSSAANQFANLTAQDLTINQYDVVLAVYYGGTVLNWIVK